MTRETHQDIVLAPMPVGTADDPALPKKSVRSEVIVYRKHLFLRRLDREPPNYDLNEVLKAEEIEAFVAQTIRNHAQTAFKRGWRLTGRNQDSLAYTRRRLLEIALATDIDTDILIRELFEDFIRFSNAAVHKKRSRANSTGNPIRKFGRTLDPVAGLFRIPMETLFPVRDDFGNVLRWEQDVPGFPIKRFLREEIVHLVRDRKGNQWMGTPDLIPVLDDIRVLRRIEELAEMLVSKSIFAFYHVKIGTSDMPAEVYEDGTSEVQQVKARIEEMPPEAGFYVTDERQDVVALSGKGPDIDVKPLLDYFSMRVRNGLNFSDIDAGTTTLSKGSAVQVSKRLVDRVKDLQQQFSKQLTFGLFIELLMEGGFEVTDENIVQMTFEEVDLEEKLSLEAHHLQQFQGNIQTRDEARMGSGKDPLEDSDDTYLNLVQIPLVVAKANAAGAVALEVAEAEAKTQKGPGGSKAVGTTNQPRNQFGISRSKPLRTRKNDCGGGFEDKMTTAEFAPDSRTLKLIQELNAIWTDARADVLDHPERLEEVLGLVRKPLVDVVKPFILRAVDAGQRNAFREMGVSGIPSFKVSTRYFEERTEKLFARTLDSVRSRLVKFLRQGENPASATGSAFDVLQYRLHFIARTELVIAENYGFTRAAKDAGVERLFWTRRLDCEDCRHLPIHVDTQFLVPEDLVPPRPNCGDRVGLKDPRLTPPPKSAVGGNGSHGVSDAASIAPEPALPSRIRFGGESGSRGPGPDGSSG